jgi:hypothetical protein
MFLRMEVTPKFIQLSIVTMRNASLIYDPGTTYTNGNLLVSPIKIYIHNISFPLRLQVDTRLLRHKVEKMVYRAKLIICFNVAHLVLGAVLYIHWFCFL